MLQSKKGEEGRKKKKIKVVQENLYKVMAKNLFVIQLTKNSVCNLRRKFFEAFVSLSFNEKRKRRTFRREMKYISKKNG